ncbi:hypothetical protein B7494_g1896 [Chlorociboria aeruginascens]|nr:hypothetical protein B7494_g1896 [Chlorociboria aeruginascens]
MRKHRVPYQCIQKCGTNTLIAGRGSSIDCFNLEDGSLSSTWKCPVKDIIQKTKSDSCTDIPQGISSPSPPTKKRKISGEAEDSWTAEAKNGKKANARSNAITTSLETPAVTTLTVTHNGQHVIAITGEDKSIRVFKWDGSGLGNDHLVQINNSTILSADKFGDVYALPLLEPKLLGDQGTLSSDSTSTTQTISKAFVPAANNLTIHSMRNRKALENQKRQTNQHAGKPAPTFEYKLLLGHVSMLTDIVLADLDGRDYIITADRDEHIRISRGIPQAYVIEAFCLGHGEFVSRLCIPKERPDLLISGGGDNALFLWSWATGRLISTISISSCFEKFNTRLETSLGENNAPVSQNPTSKKIAVSGIYHHRESEQQSPTDIIIVTCEGVPAIATFILTSENRLKHLQTLELAGNVLDIIINNSPDQNSVVVSVDSFHRPGSTAERRDDSEEVIKPLLSFQFQDRMLVEQNLFDLERNGDVIKHYSTQVTVANLPSLLYNLENLRKKDDGLEDE